MSRGSVMLTIAEGYDRRKEVADAVRASLTEEAGKAVEHITASVIGGHMYMYVAEAPDSDLIIRTGGKAVAFGAPAMVECLQRVLLYRRILGGVSQERLPTRRARPSAAPSGFRSERQGSSSQLRFGAPDFRVAMAVPTWNGHVTRWSN